MERFNPAVPRRFLYALAGLLWTVAGGLLCVRGAIWLQDLQLPVIASVEAAAIAIAAAGYVFLFSGVVRNNIARIGRLPDRACVFAFTAPRGYIMIAVMMTAGISLRTSSIPHYYLSLPYSAMGGVLLTGSVGFYRKFFGTAAAKQPL
jgi:hypothetical protein